MFVLPINEIVIVFKFSWRKENIEKAFKLSIYFNLNTNIVPFFANTNVLYKWGMDYHKLGSHKQRWKSTQKLFFQNYKCKYKYKTNDHLINLTKSLIVFSDISHHLYKEKSSFSLSYTWWCHNSTYYKSTIYVFLMFYQNIHSFLE